MTADTASPPAASPSAAPGRAAIGAGSLRRDRWWIEPLITVTVLVAFIAYSTFRTFYGKHYYVAGDHLLSPFYSPCLSGRCNPAPHLSWFPTTKYVATPAIWVLIFPLGFRLTCYYYRKAYYRSFWASPPACAVAEPHKRYTGETRAPLIGNNLHRYFFYFGVVFVGILVYDAVDSFRNQSGWGHMGLGSLILIADFLLLGAYTLSCHSCRHILGGKLRNFSKHPVRYRAWGFISVLNGRHMLLAWVSLFGVALTDLYVYLVSAGVFSDPRFF